MSDDTEIDKNQCPKCQSENLTVVDSRPANNGKWRRRRRRCNACDHRWSTLEVPEEVVALAASMVRAITESKAATEAFLLQLGDLS